VSASIAAAQPVGKRPKRAEKNRGPWPRAGRDIPSLEIKTDFATLVPTLTGPSYSRASIWTRPCKFSLSAGTTVAAPKD